MTLLTLKIKWQSFNYFNVIVVYHRATKANRFAENRIKKIPTRCRFMLVKSQIGHFTEMKNPCYYK